MTPTLNKYLSRNPLRHDFEPSAPGRLYRAAVVIPAAGEADFLPATLASLTANPPEFRSDTLILAVVNQSADATPERRLDNAHTLTRFRDGSMPGRDRLNLYWLDATAPGRELRHGVGDARKTGMDAVLPFLDWNRDPLILCLDADTVTEPDYLAAVWTALAAEPMVPGGVLRFLHQPGDTPETEQAIREYETYMQDYVDKLAAAGSPYAYHAMGSAMVCRAEAYLRSGGMKPRNAGEDFYFLQSLRKLGPIIAIDGSTVHPSARPSDRVPFGTGATIRKILSGNSQSLHHDDIFAILKTIYDTVNTADTEQLQALPALLSEVLPVAGRAFLDANDFTASWQKIVANTPATKKHLHMAFHTWFDAFRTLKFVHYCEENHPDRFPRQGKEYTR